MKDVLKRLGRGDDAAFVELYNKYSGKCYAFVKSLVKDEAVAKDLVQDIFIKVWTQREVISQVSSFDSYLFRMARNSILHLFYNKEVRRRYIAREMLLQDGLVNRTSETIDESELQLLIYKTVSGMPPQRQKVFRMSRYYGIPNSRIALELGISMRTVENHLTAALKDIRCALAAI